MYPLEIRKFYCLSWTIENNRKLTTFLALWIMMLGVVFLILGFLWPSGGVVVEGKGRSDEG